MNDGHKLSEKLTPCLDLLFLWMKKKLLLYSLRCSCHEREGEEGTQVIISSV